MKTFKEEIKSRLDKEEKYRDLLFRRGYLLTDAPIINSQSYPFYGLWQESKIQNYFLYVQRSQTYYKFQEKDITVAIIGHAYNPFTMCYDENKICCDLVKSYKQNINQFFDKVSELTGLHIIIICDKGNIIMCQDACGLTGCYYCTVGDSFFVSEHPQLIADLQGFSFDKTVEKLVKSKCYNIGNRHLPGNITPYQEIKKIAGNTFLRFNNNKFSVGRFFPTKNHIVYTTESEKQDAVKEIGNLIHNGIECCTKKWNNCAISLSGGTDSKTTLACANGLYDKFSYFSFYSKAQELVDANGAKKICDKLGLKHTLYKIPENNEEIDDFQFIKTILQHNTNYFVNLADNEIRKFIYLHNINAYDIELKSWASEVARVFLERKYQIKMPNTLTERHCSIFQTRYFGHPSLLKWSDKIYYNYLREIGLDKPLFNYEHSDLFYWEIRMGSWGVSVISSQQLYHRMTMPMNNRKILDMFLCFPHDERKQDLVHKQIMNSQNPDVINSNVDIPNLYFHKYRILMEKTFYYFRTLTYHRKK